MNEVVTIEPVSLAHAERLQRLISDPAVAEPTSNIPHPYPEGGAVSWIRDAQKRREEGIAYGFAVLANLEFVGSVSILNVSGVQGEIGYWIGRSYWGRGFATKAGQLAIAFAFQDALLELLIGKCLLRNRGSFRVLERIGFTLTGFSEISKPKWPEPERVAEFVLSREAWRKTQI